eukprot:scaffold1933_cov145-Skeletonema_dohrnii-CCMP3373.AAC.11
MMCTSSAVTSVLTHTKLLNTPQRLQPLCSYATISWILHWRGLATHAANGQAGLRHPSKKVVGCRL